MTPEERLTMATNQLNSIQTWLERQTRTYEKDGDTTTACALDDIALHLQRLERTLTGAGQ